MISLFGWASSTSEPSTVTLDSGTLKNTGIYTVRYSTSFAEKTITLPDNLDSVTITFDMRSVVQGSYYYKNNPTMRITDMSNNVLVTNGYLHYSQNPSASPPIFSITDTGWSSFSFTIPKSILGDNNQIKLKFGSMFNYISDSGDTIYLDNVDIQFATSQQDTTPPIITLTGSNPQSIELGAGYTELYATTNDGSPVTIDSSAFTDSIGSYSVTYNSVDSSGNNADTITRTITVVDTTPPIITLTGSNPQSIELGAGYTELYATTNDGSPVTIDSSAFTDSIGSYSVTYNSVDSSGNNADTITRTITVLDTTPPIIIPPDNITAEASGEQTSLDIGSATVTDNTNSNPTVTNNAPIISLWHHYNNLDCNR